jgi:hypothetical protein
MQLTTASDAFKINSVMPLSPLWANLPRRHCDDCGKLFKPVKPSRPGECYFCSANCRKSYHKHGGAYRKLKAEMQKMIRRELPMLVSAGVAAELNRRGLGIQG